MSSTFYRKTFLSTKHGHLSVALGSYILGEPLRSDLTGELFRHGAGRDDVACSGTLLPPDAPLWFLDGEGNPNPQAIWNANDRTELSANKRNREPKWKKRGQLAMHVIAALPWEVSDEVREQIARRHAEEFARRGAVVTWAIHKPSEQNSKNHHLHLLVSTRRVTPQGFGKKVRGLAAAFSRGEGHERATIHKDSPPRQWRAFLEQFAAEHGIELEFNVPQAVAGVHWGNAPRRTPSEKQKADAEARAAARALLLDPSKLLEVVTTRQAVFTRRDLLRLLRAHEIVGEEADSIFARALADPEILHLRDSATNAHHGLFTTRSVRAQEMRILAAADQIRNRPMAPADVRAFAAAAARIQKGRLLSAEQKAAFLRCLGEEGLSIIQGLAGAGKSFIMAVIRDALEAAGYRVIGLAPTNAVTADMATGGFHTASTIHLELLRQETKTGWYEAWNARTCLILDEAAMIDANLYERLLVRAAEAGARVVLVGDDRQLSSIERGGIYGYLKKTCRFALLREVRRQNEPWAKKASLSFAEGRLLDGLKPYHERGYITFHADIAEAANALVRQCLEDQRQEPDKPRFVYAATRDAVARLNLGLQQGNWTLRPPERKQRLQTANGEVEFGSGDRIQFFGNERKLGIVNGLIGTIVAMQADAVTVKTDEDRIITFDPTVFDQFGLGFAGTIYRGQGRTQVQTYCLYDHAFAWGSASSYVAFTRHKESVRCYVPRPLAADLETLARQMSKSDPRVSSLEFVSEEELRGEIPAGPSDDRALVNNRTVAEPRLELRAAVVKPDVDADFAPSSEIVATSPTRPAEPNAQHSPKPAADPAPASLGLPSDVVPAIAGPSSGAGGGPGRRTGTMPALPYRTYFAGQDRSFDLSLPGDEVELLDALSNEPMKRVVEVYGDLQRTAANADPATAGHLRGLLRRITTQSQDRGFLPRENRVYAECLHYTRLDPHNIIHDEALRKHKDEVDIAPMVEPLYDVKPDVRRNLAAKLKGFVIEALRNIDGSLGNASVRARHDEALQFAIINTRAWLYDVTYAWGLDLHPDVSRALGRRAMPDEYRDQYLSLARKAEKAAGLQPAPPAPEAQPQTVIRRPIYPHFDYHKERLLTELYRTRLVAQVAEAAKMFDDAMIRRNFAEYCSGGRSAVHRDEEEAAQLRLDGLKRKLAAFEADPARTIRVARPLDFLPASVTEKDVVGPKVFYAPRVTGFQSPDKATQMLEAILRERLWMRVRQPRQVQPEQQQPSQPTPTKQIDRTAGREID
ncbi:hypothetical protein FRZ61_01440 [Hypericibacter adhaerens]|uniref:MobA/MobL protein domain-containing protein n=2 Tax=Hypericibacter adhaerens TaxID=2602016 RepID=A0A5J6MRR8_9PROT|nr:hypothetical protein FRZ61_01440 [Hypericibacter adhaerens]